MKGEGNYNKNSGQQRKALDRAIKAVERNVTAMSERSLLPLPGATAGHFTIADYGASQGANSIIVCEKVVAILRKRHAQLPIVIVHEDLDENDWTTLFKTSHSNALGANTFVLGSGASFYEQVLPPASVDFAFSGTAFHWQRFPLPQPETAAEEEIASKIMQPWLLPEGPYLERFKQHALDNWALNCKHRAAEMKPGARGVFLFMPVPLKPVMESARVMSSLMARLVEEGLMTRREAINAKIPIFGVPKEKMLEIVKAAGFEVESYEHFIVGDSFLQEYERTKDAEQYATSIEGWIRAVNEPTIAASIGDPVRRMKAVEMYFKWFNEEVKRRMAEKINWVAYANHLLSVIRLPQIKANI